MSLDFEKEDILKSAREKVGEAAEELEEILPDTAEELSWIWESLRDEIRTAKRAREGGAL